ncbi:MAG: helix-turn-helix domain-containing protein [Bacteroides sp.]
MTVIERFQQVMEHFGLNAGTFAERINVSQATISHIINGRNKYPSTDVLLRLHDTFPKVNLNWLITGEGISGLEEDNENTPSDPNANPDSSDSPTYDGVSANNGTAAAKYRKENGLDAALNAAYEAKKQEVVYRERPQRKITEIRIFFDDNTFETFTP